jgi:hypothetical protein
VVCDEGRRKRSREVVVVVVVVVCERIPKIGEGLIPVREKMRSSIARD